MTLDWQRILPVIVSIIIIIFVAILRNYSAKVAAITATMPINIPLALWIVYAGAKDNPALMVEFSEGMLLGIFPTIGFLVICYVVLRAGWSLLLVIGAGYAGWGAMLLVAFLVRRGMGG